MNVTQHPARYSAPHLSPDGAKVTFHSDRGGSYDVWAMIYVMDADGSGLTQLTDDPADDGRAIWVKR